MQSIQNANLEYVQRVVDMATTMYIGSIPELNIGNHCIASLVELCLYCNDRYRICLVIVDDLKVIVCVEWCNLCWIVISIILNQKRVSMKESVPRLLK